MDACFEPGVRAAMHRVIDETDNYVKKLEDAVAARQSVMNHIELMNDAICCHSCLVLFATPQQKHFVKPLEL